MLQCMFEPALVDEIESIESTSWNIRNKSQMYELVDDLCNIHNELCDTLEIVSEYFSIKMVIIIATAFLCILTNGYLAFISIYTQHEDRIEDLEHAMVNYGLVESGFIALSIILACNCCQGIKNEVICAWNNFRGKLEIKVHLSCLERTVLDLRT